MTERYGFMGGSDGENVVIIQAPRFPGEISKFSFDTRYTWISGLGLRHRIKMAWGLLTGKYRTVTYCHIELRGADVPGAKP